MKQQTQNRNINQEINNFRNTCLNDKGGALFAKLGWNRNPNKWSSLSKVVDKSQCLGGKLPKSKKTHKLLNHQKKINKTNFLSNLSGHKWDNTNLKLLKPLYSFHIPL